MKKFLTVLLALSVVFTYSFSAVGTAFADTAPVKATTEQAKLLAEAKAYAESIVTANYDNAYKAAAKEPLAYTPSSITAAAAWETVDVKATLQSFINDQYVKAAANYTYTTTDKKELAGEVFATANGFISETDADGPAVASDKLRAVIIDLCKVAVNVNAYEADRQELLDAFDKVDYSVYSDTEVEKTSGKTYQTLAKEKVAEGKAKLANDRVFDAETLPEANIKYLNGSMANFKFEWDKYLTEKTIDVNGKPVGLGVYTVTGIDTIEDLANAGLITNATTASLKAQIAKNVAVYLNDKTITPDKAFATNYTTLYNYLAEEIPTVAGLARDLTYHETHMTAAQENLATKIKDAIAAVEEMNAFADKYAAEKNADGILVRDPAKVAKVAEEYKLAAYKAAVSLGDAPDAAEYKAKIVNMTISSVEEGLAFHKEVAKNQLADNKAAVIDNYYALEAAKVEANYKKALAQIEAADTVDKVHAVDITSATMTAGIKTAKQVDTATAASASAKSALDAVNAYITYANSGKTAINSDYILAYEPTIKDIINGIYGDAGARKDSERKAVSVDVSAVVAKLPTVGTLTAAKDAANAAIKALPVKVTVADKDSVIEAWDLKDAFETIKADAGANVTLDYSMDKAIQQLFADMQFDFAKKISAVDKNDKAALRALQTELDNADALIDDGEIFDGFTPASFDSNNVVSTAIKNIRKAELDNVIKLINAIPVNVTEADKATVEAARKAYDEFVKDWTAYNDCVGETDYYAAGAVTNFRVLALAEAALGLNADPGKEVEALKITASSTAKKGSITVKWTVKGDTSVADGFQVYRSLKMNSGFGTKAFFTTTDNTKRTYKNTKSLKKGTRYYYKIRAYKVVDGVKYYSDWSNKAYRIAK